MKPAADSLDAEQESPSWALLACATACTCSLAGISIFRLGLPLDLKTWLVVVAAAASGLCLTNTHIARLGGFVLGLLAAVYLAFPWVFQVIPGVEVWSTFDSRGGRVGWILTPGLRFGSDGPNTALLENTRGPLEPDWRIGASYSPYIRDGNERVDTRNVIRAASFSSMLECLPSDDARHEVMHALTEPENRLRPFQSLLLVCLHDWGYPEEGRPEEWWAQHRDLFAIETDPKKGASLVFDWQPRLESLVAKRPSS